MRKAPYFFEKEGLYMLHKNPVFRGAATALVTPFRGNRLDHAAFSLMIRKQIRAGVRALVVAGTTGEASALSEKEHAALVASAKETAQKSVPVIAGCGAAVTQKAVTLARNAAAMGADALLCVTPYYNKCSEGGLYRHFSTVADAARIPLILYEVPSRTGLSVSPAVYARLSSHPLICGIKDASGSIAHTMDIIRATNGTLPIYAGDDGLVLPMLALGADGVISVASNLMPKEVASLCDTYFEGDVKGAATLQFSLLPLIRALFSEVNPIPVKTALAEMGLCTEEFRLPLCPLDAEKKAAFAKVLDSYGLHR